MTAYRRARARGTPETARLEWPGGSARIVVSFRSFSSAPRPPLGESPLMQLFPAKLALIAGAAMILAAGAEPPTGSSRFPWASLIWRLFLADVLECALCGGRMEPVAVVTVPAAIARVLDHLGLHSNVPTFRPARPPTQLGLPHEAFDQDAVDPPSRDDSAT